MSALLRLRALAANIGSVKWAAALHTTIADGGLQANGWRTDDRQTKAVIFDMGGVIIPSPLPFIMGQYGFLLLKFSNQLFEYDILVLMSLQIEEYLLNSEVCYWSPMLF